MSETMESDPASMLHGENLAYYRNIEYLKEMTAQATSLLSRSNAVYKNILDDVELASKVRGFSDVSALERSHPQTSRCPFCDLYHGAPFCILDNILEEEHLWALKHKRTVVEPVGPQWKETRKSTIEDSKIIPTYRRTISHDKRDEIQSRELPPSIGLDKKTPEEILSTYEALCHRIGASNGKRYLLATLLQGESSQWAEESEDTELEKSKIKFRETEIDCHIHAPVRDNFCPQYSENVRKKLNKVVEVIPNGQTRGFEYKKRWKDILCKPRRASEHKKLNYEQEVEVKETPDSSKLVICKCAALDCDCGGKQGCSIRPVEKKCKLLYDEANNYMSVVRNKIRRRRVAREKVRRMSSVTSGSRTTGTKRRRSSIFVTLANADLFGYIDSCLNKHFKGNQDNTLDNYLKNVSEVVKLVTPTAVVPERDWNAWYDAYRDARDRDRLTDGTESTDSDLISSDSGLSDRSKNSDLDYKENKTPTSRIPFAHETYNQINRLFDKISLKLENSIASNSKHVNVSSFKPLIEYTLRKLSLFKGENRVLKEMYSEMQRTYLDVKVLTPFSVIKRKKINQIKVISTKYRRAYNRRNFIEGIQLGRRLKYRKNSEKYTLEGGYLGFSPQKRKLLRMIESKRFETCDLVGDDAGRKLTTKTFHDDYRLLCNLFDEPPPDLRRTLLDEIMKQRMEKYGKFNYMYGESTSPEPPECCSEPDMFNRQNSYQSRENLSGRKTEKQEMKFVRASPKKYSTESAVTGGHEYASVRSSVPYSGRDIPKSYYSSGREARFSSNLAITKRVSQNVLLGSDNESQNPLKDDPSLQVPRIDGSSKELRRSTKTSSRSVKASSALVGENKLPLPPINSVQNLKNSITSVQASGSRRTSRITPSSHGPTEIDDRPSINAESAKLAPKGSTQVGSKTIDPQRGSKIIGSQVISKTINSEVNSKTVDSASKKISISDKIDDMGSRKIEYPTVSSIMGESVVFNSERQITESIVAQPGSKLISRKKGGLVVPQSQEIEEPNSRSQTTILRGSSDSYNKQRKVLASESSNQSSMSLTKGRKGKAVDRLGPTKKRSFGVDIGQGINYVQYLRECAANSDENKKKELLNLLTEHREKKKGSVKQTSSKTVLLPESQQGSSSQEYRKSDEHVSRKPKKISIHTVDSVESLEVTTKIKTLDQIYKEVHGINKRNTPASLIENDYEHELLKIQQLRKHRIG